VVPRAVVRDRFDERDSARMYSLLMLILGVSPIFAPSVGSQLVGWIGWRGLFWVLAGLGVICAITVITSLPKSPQRETTPSLGLATALRNYAYLLTDPRFIGPALVAGFTFGTIFTY